MAGSEGWQKALVGAPGELMNLDRWVVLPDDQMVEARRKQCSGLFVLALSVLLQLPGSAGLG